MRPEVGERLEAVLVEQARRQLELGLDVGLVGGRAEEARVALRPEEEPDGLGEDRLARTGLARDRVQPGRELELGLADEHEVLDTEPAQHGSNRREGIRRRPSAVADTATSAAASAP